MNKTIFNLNLKMSVIILASLGVLFSVMSNAFYVDDFIGFILCLFRSVLIVGGYLGIYLLEKHNTEFKSITKRMFGYLGMCYVANQVCILFSLTHILKNTFLTISGLVCFYTIVMFVLELINIFYSKRLVKQMIVFNERKTLFLTNLLLELIERKK